MVLRQDGRLGCDARRRRRKGRPSSCGPQRDRVGSRTRGVRAEKKEGRAPGGRFKVKRKDTTRREEVEFQGREDSRTAESETEGKFAGEEEDGRITAREGRRLSSDSAMAESAVVTASHGKSIYMSSTGEMTAEVPSYWVMSARNPL